MLLVLFSTKDDVAAPILSYRQKHRVVTVFGTRLIALLLAVGNKKGPQSGPFCEADHAKSCDLDDGGFLYQLQNIFVGDAFVFGNLFLQVELQMPFTQCFFESRQRPLLLH